MGEVSTTPFGELLRRRRVASGLSQEELAERAGLSRRGISDLERGERTTPRLETVRLLADALGLDATARAELLAAARPELAPRPAAHGPTSQVPTRPLPSQARLPIPPTKLVGRERKSAEIVALLLREDVRLVTLTGPGGIGKTRLALAVAAAVIDGFASGVTLVDLAPVTTPELVAAAVARALDVQEEGDRPLVETLKVAVGTRELLLILDNFEHVLPAAPLVSDLLSACPGLKVLATSRERLHLRGERAVAVEPLALPGAPDPANPAPLAGLAGVAAVRLFVERAEEVRHGFALTEANAAAVAEIVRRLDGLPLAIELAAAWVRVLAPDALAKRLRRPLPLLAEGPRDMPARQQTLTATIGWSYDLLRPEERELFRRLALFAGGFSVDGAEAVGAEAGAADGDAAHAVGSAVVAGLTSLLDKSLVRRTEGRGGARFAMLETVRQFGLQRLAEAGELEAVRARLAAWCLAVAEQGAKGLKGATQATWLARLSDEHDNFRTALQWAIERGEAEIGLRLGAALWRFWFDRAYAGKGRRWLDRLLALDGDVQPATRAGALYGAGTLASCQSDHPRSAALFQEALSVYRSLGEAEGEARCLTALGIVAQSLPDHAQATALLEEALVVYRRLGNADGLGVCLGNLGNIAYLQGDYLRAAACFEEALAHRRSLGVPADTATLMANLGLAVDALGNEGRAEELYEESLRLARSVGATGIVGSCLSNLGSLAYRRADFARARRLYEESTEIWRDVGNTFLFAWARTDLGLVAYAQGDFVLATAHLVAGLETKLKVGGMAGVAESFVGLAQVAVSEHPERAACLLGVAEALGRQTTQRLNPTYQATFDRVAAVARTRLGEVALAERFEAGQAMPLDEAVAFALDRPAEAPLRESRQT